MYRTAVLTGFVATTLAIALTLPTAASEAPERSSEPRVMILRAGDGEGGALRAGVEPADLLQIDASELTVGFNHTFWTQEGRRVDIFRETPDSFVLEIDGKEYRMERPEAPMEGFEGRREVQVLRLRKGDEAEALELDTEVVRALVLRGSPGEATGPRLRIELKEEGIEGENVTVRKRVLVVPTVPDPD